MWSTWMSEYYAYISRISTFCVLVVIFCGYFWYVDMRSKAVAYFVHVTAQILNVIRVLVCAMRVAHAVMKSTMLLHGGPRLLGK
jgi:hypothetical protein